MSYTADDPCSRVKNFRKRIAFEPRISLRREGGPSAFDCKRADRRYAHSYFKLLGNKLTMAAALGKCVHHHAEIPCVVAEVGKLVAAAMKMIFWISSSRYVPSADTTCRRLGGQLLKVVVVTIPVVSSSARVLIVTSSKACKTSSRCRIDRLSINRSAARRYESKVIDCRSYKMKCCTPGCDLRASRIRRGPGIRVLVRVLNELAEMFCAKLDTQGALPLVPSFFFVKGSARVTVWMHSY